MHLSNIYKQTVMTFREQKIFLMSIMKNKNFVSYVQRQMKTIFRSVKEFAKIFIDDIVIRSKFFDDYMTHVRAILEIFTKYNIFIKSTKVVLNYFDVVLFKQRINALEFIITKKRLKFIIKIKFSTTLKNLKHYPKLTEYIRNHIYYYSVIVKSLQNF